MFGLGYSYKDTTKITNCAGKFAYPVIEYQVKLQIVSLSLQIAVFGETPVSPFLQISFNLFANPVSTFLQI